jgi:hypothetical protein
MAFGILQTFFNRAAFHGKLQNTEALNHFLMQFQAKGQKHFLDATEYEEIIRPPIATLEKYRAKRTNYEYHE